MTISVSRSSYHGEFDYGVFVMATDGFIDITVTGERVTTHMYGIMGKQLKILEILERVLHSNCYRW